MIQVDFDTFTVELTRLSEYYEKPMSEGQVALYFESLSVYPIEEVIRAMRQHVRMPEQGRWWPKVADLVGLIEGDSESAALRAWSVTVEVWERYGIYASVTFADPCLAAVIEDMGGWIAFGERYKQLKEEPFMRQEFVKRYRGALQRPPRQAVGVLPGLHALANTRRGFVHDIPKAIAIGEAPRRKAMTDGGPTQDGT